MKRTNRALAVLLAVALVGAAACSDEVPDEAAPRPAKAAATETPSVAPRRHSEDEAAPETPAATDAEGRTRVTFRVVEEEGRAPVAGAVVAEIRRDAGPEMRTDAAGVAQFDVALKFAGTQFDVRAPGFVRRVVRVDAETDTSKPVEVGLARGVTVTGKVLASEGGAIAGARVRVEYGQQHDEELRQFGAVRSGHHGVEWELRGRGSRAPSADEVASDAAGGFAIDGIPKDAGVVTVVATAPSRLRAIAAWKPGGAPVEIRLRPGAAVSGIVRGPDGTPVEGAQVRLWLPKDDRKSEPDVQASFGEITGDDGRYRIDGVAPGHRWMLDVDHAGFADRAPTEVSVDGETTCDVELFAVAHVEFTTLAPDGSPIENVSYTLTVDESTSSGNRSGPGPVGIDIRRPGACRLVVITAEYAPKPVEFTIAAGERRAIEVRVEAGAAIAGFVEDDAGRRVARASVRALAGERSRVAAWEFNPPDTTEADGAFRVDGLAEGSYVLEASAAGYEPARVEGVTAPADGVRIVLRRRAQVLATFHAPDGSSLPDRWWVRAERAGDRANAIRGDDAAWMGKPISLVAGSWRLTINVDGFVPVEREIELAPGETRTLGVELDPGVSVAGRVVDERGHGVEDARVAAARRAAKTDEDGRFTLEHVPRGELDVLVTAEEYLDVHVRRETSAADEFVVTLRHGGLVRGTVRDAAGAPVTMGQIHFTPANESAGRPAPLDFCDDAGTFEIRLVAGEYSVTAVVAGGSASGKVTVKAGGETKVDLVVGR